MALSMMVEKESGKMEGNDFENLWSRVAQRDGKVWYVSLASCSLGPMIKNSQLSLHRYRDAVTGSTRADAPPLCLGGLLADVRPFFSKTSIAFPQM